MAICNKCNQETGDSRYCTNCGHPMEADNQNIYNTNDPYTTPAGMNHAPGGYNSNGARPVKHRKKRSSKGLLISLIAIILIVGIIGSAANKNKETDGNDNQNQEEKADVPEEYTVGHKITIGDVSVSFLDVRESEGSAFLSPDEGNIYVIPVFEIENNSDKEILMSTVMNFDVYADGYSTSLSIGALTEKDGEQLDGSIPAGKKLKGSVGYEVPSDYQELEITVKLDVWSKDKVTFVYRK